MNKSSHKVNKKFFTSLNENFKIAKRNLFLTSFKSQKTIRNIYNLFNFPYLTYRELHYV